MKNLLVVLFVIGLSFSCSKLKKESTFNPPDWIQGTWKDSTATDTWKFEEDNVINTLTTNGFSTTMNYKETYQLAPNNVEEEVSNTSYSFTIKSGSAGVSTSITTTFAKVSSTEMTKGIDGSGMTTYTKQ